MIPIPATLVQSDFDGTITTEDVSHLLLDRFGTAGWRDLLGEYRAGALDVETFMRRAFAPVREDRDVLAAYALDRARVRPGFAEFAAFCARNRFRLAIVSHGLGFYIRAILDRLGLSGLEVHAAAARFGPGKPALRYRGPGGRHRRGFFKIEYLESFRRRFERIIYLGNGVSDVAPARLADRVFATGDLAGACRAEGLHCSEFETFHDILRELEPGGPAEARAGGAAPARGDPVT